MQSSPLCLLSCKRMMAIWDNDGAAQTLACEGSGSSAEREAT